MRLNNRLAIVVALTLSACGGGRSLPPAPQAGYPQQYPQQYPQDEARPPRQPSRVAQEYPMSTDPRYAGPGASYPAPVQGYPQQPSYPQQAQGYPPAPGPARDLGPEDAYQPEASGSAGASYSAPRGSSPGSSYPAPSSGYPPAPAPSYQNGYPQSGYQTGGYQPPSYPQAAPPAQNLPVQPGGQLPPEQRYDQVGYAGWSTQAGTVAGAHRSLTPGAFVEVTALDTGKTILVPITARAQSTREIELSGTAAQLLGLNGNGAAVRVRRVLPTAADQNRLRMGQAAEPRYDTPPVLLRALRARLTGTPGAAPAPVPAAPYPAPGASYGGPGASYPPPGATYRPPARPTPAVPTRTTPQGPGYYVQLAALSNSANATRLAREAGAGVRQGSGLFLVRAGPFTDLRTAQAARDDFAGRGYADARIVRE